MEAVRTLRLLSHFISKANSRFPIISESKIFFDTYHREREEKQVTEYLLSNVENILLNGTQLILNEVFKTIGFDAINDDILKKTGNSSFKSADEQISNCRIFKIAF